MSCRVIEAEGVQLIILDLIRGSAKRAWPTLSHGWLHVTVQGDNNSRLGVRNTFNNYVNLK